MNKHESTESQENLLGSAMCKNCAWMFLYFDWIQALDFFILRDLKLILYFSIILKADHTVSVKTK